MKIQKFEQSGFIIQSESGFRLGLDIGNKTPLENLTNISVDAFLVSHIHGDHFSLPHIKTVNPKQVFLNTECVETLGEETVPFEIITITDKQDITVGDMVVQTFNVDHGPNVSVPLAENFGFLITADNQTIYFAGDMFYQSGIDVENLEVDYALIPIGTFYTFGPDEAFQFIKQFKRIGKVISMHYEKTPETQGQFLGLVKGIFDAE